ncbi:hypothetical protein EMPG_15799 [Blastomyces silverae]|uniref:Uncharacterized protein n=1 Tax=Blastomyces silverae TaxID=2060906 RepID=A0A0H1BBL0_9EURO|nr:hypothetical protein EMPG_15799 [Blastomyces silverae]
MAIRPLRLSMRRAKRRTLTRNQRSGLRSGTLFARIIIKKSNAAAAKQSMKASTKLPRWSLAAKRLKAPSSSAQSTTSTNSKTKPRTWLRAGIRPT